MNDAVEDTQPEPIMRFFTHKNAYEADSDDVWPRVCAEYNEHLSRRMTDLPRQVKELLDGVPFAGIHDAQIIAMTPGKHLRLSLVTGDLQHGYWDVTLSFDDATVRTRGANLEDLVGDLEAELLYQEMDRDETHFYWRVLVWEDIEVEIKFTDVAVTWSPRQAR